MTTIYTTVPSKDEASEISRALVEERLAACVNMHQVGSVYRWQNEIVEQNEVALDIKTSRDFEEVKSRLLEIHPYDVPAIIEHEPENVLDDYDEWVEDCC